MPRDAPGGDHRGVGVGARPSMAGSELGFDVNKSINHGDNRLPRPGFSSTSELSKRSKYSRVSRPSSDRAGFKMDRIKKISKSSPKIE